MKFATDTGHVAVRSAGGRVLLHLAREDQTRTVCGRYDLDRILEENYDVTGVRECRVCRDVIDHHDSMRMTRGN